MKIFYTISTFGFYIFSLALIGLTSSTNAMKIVEDGSKIVKPFLYQSHKKRGSKGVHIPVPYIIFKEALNETKVANLFDKVELVCDVMGFPPPSIRWLKNGEDFAGMESQSPYNEALAEREEARYMAMIKTWGQNVYSLNIGRSTSKLTIECLRPEDLGEYTCIVETKYQMEKSKTILMTPPSGITEIGKYSSRLYCNKESFLTVPTVFSRTKAVFELQGLDLVIECRYSNGETKETKWLGPNDEVLPKNSEKYKVLDNGDLIIRNLVWNDMGSYTCVIETPSRTAEGDTFVYPVKPSKKVY